MSIIVKGLVKNYNGQLAVDNVSFTVNKGEILGFLGPNGAGKSTTMKIATGYVPPTEGTVLLAGYDIRQHSLEVRRNVGYLPEHNPLYLDMYVHEFLHFVGQVHGMKYKARLVAIKDIIEKCGLQVEQGKKIGALSKGYRQRVGLAQALLHDPQVLILDEPTTGLDPNQIQEIRQLIKEVSADKTVIFSTHIMQEVQAICDRAVIINRGKVVIDSPIAALRQASAGHDTLRITFDKPIEASLMLAIENVGSVEQVNELSYKIKTNDIAATRKAVMGLVAKHDWQLASLTAEENSLEDIFKQLTTNHPN